SFKATQNAFRNLTNRMEEAVGDCTNLHLRYPALVYGFYHILLAIRPSQIGSHPLIRDSKDISIADDGTIEPQVLRYLRAIEALCDRKSQWEEPSAYEAVGIEFIESAPTVVGQLYGAIDVDSPVHGEGFLKRLLDSYDFRYP